MEKLETKMKTIQVYHMINQSYNVLYISPKEMNTNAINCFYEKVLN